MQLTRPADVAPTFAPTPGSLVFKAYGSALMSLPGVTGGGWSRATPDEVYVRVANAEVRQLADNVLADTIDGVRIVFEVEDGASTVPPGSWVNRPSSVVRAMTALPGVVGARTLRNLYVLETDTRERAAWLWNLVEHDVLGTPLAAIVAGDLG